MIGEQLSWYNGMRNLTTVVRELSLDDLRSRLGIGALDGWIDSSEIYNMYSDFADIVGPQNVRRYRKLPDDIDERMVAFERTLNDVVLKNLDDKSDAEITASSGWADMQDRAARLAERLNQVLVEVSVAEGVALAPAVDLFPRFES